MRCKLVLLAAGQSRRWGTDNKLLAQYRGKALYRHTLDILWTLCRSKPEELELLVVTCWPEIEARCNEQGISVVYNPRAEEGISTSLILGLKEGRTSDCTAFFVADQPCLTSESIRRFLEGFLQSGKGLGCVTAQGRRGNPCIFASTYYRELLEVTGDRGGKQVLLSYPEDLWTCEVPAEELQDLDTKTDKLTGSEEPEERMK